MYRSNRPWAPVSATWQISPRQPSTSDTARCSGRASKASLYSSTLVTFEDDKGAYDQKDAQGFIKLNALRLRTLAQRKRTLKHD